MAEMMAGEHGGAREKRMVEPDYREDPSLLLSEPWPERREGEAFLDYLNRVSWAFTRGRGRGR